MKVFWQKNNLRTIEYNDKIPLAITKALTKKEVTIMAVLSINFYSTVLGHDTDVNVIIPDEKNITDFSIKRVEYDTVYLLHGMGDNASGWGRYSNVERYANETGFLVVMPSAEHSYYTNAVNGKAWGDFFEIELPYHLNKWFNLSQNKFIAGLSMGGYGAFKIGLMHLNEFKGIAGFSSVISLVELKKQAPEELKPTVDQVYKTIFGTTDPTESIHNLVSEVETYCIDQKGPLIIHYCGLDDFLYDDNMVCQH